MNKFYVYVDWTLEGIQRPYYVGKGTLQRIRRKYRNKRHESIKKLYGLERKIILETEDETEAFALETKLILEYKTYAYNQNSWGANFTLGGEGSSGRILSEDSLRLIRVPHGKKHSDEQKSKWSLMRKGKKISQAHKENIRLASLNRRHSDVTKENLRNIASEWWKKRKEDPHAKKINYKCRQVEQINLLDNSVIAVYESITAACRALNCKNISKCCTGKRKSAGGYGWRYKDSQTL